MQIDPHLSSDPVVCAAVRRQDANERNMTYLRSLMDMYVRGQRPVEMRPAVSPLEHYSMLDSPDCGCSVCSDWEIRREEFVQAVRLIPKGHKWTICGCDDCRFVGRFQMNYLAATNRRDLTIEMSFHAYYHSQHGPLVMQWLDKELRNPAYTVNWCAQEMSRFPMERWLTRCETAVSGLASGAVFQSTFIESDLESPISSSLFAELGSVYVEDIGFLKPLQE